MPQTHAAQRELYPPIEPYDHGLLDVGDGHRVYWERRAATRTASPPCSCMAGRAAAARPSIGGCSIPTRYRVLLFDQRGCGRSLPHRRRSRPTRPGIWWPTSSGCARMMGVERWLVFGGSWGSTLALAYAADPSGAGHASWSCAASSRCGAGSCVWYYQHGASLLFPDKWERFLAPIPADERGDLIAAYRRRLTDPDPAVQLAGRARLEPVGGRDDHAAARRRRTAGSSATTSSRCAFARIENHYFVHAGWLEEGQLLRDAPGCARSPA